MSKVVLGLASTLLLAALPALALVVQPGPQAGEVALVLTGPLGADAAGVAAEAGLWEISPERALGGVFVLLETSDDLDRLYAHGALVVLSGEAILALCSS